MVYLRNNIACGIGFGKFVKSIVSREPEMFSYTFRILMRAVSFVEDDRHDKTIVSRSSHN